LPKILSQWQQKFQLLVRQKSAAELVRQEIFAFAIAQNFLTAIFHRRVCFLKLNVLIHFRYISNDFKILKNVLDGNEWKY